ncbi:MAG: hypothetical protein LBU64_11175 [Planctomycetota bacterium]|jgi:DNA-binding CsgD family transcriptional regulator|nr:hypothetical protein [Planctomycetota bacterium]
MELIPAAEIGAETFGGSLWQLALILAAIVLLGAYSRWRRARTPPPATLADLRKMDQTPERFRSLADQAIVDLLETSRTLNAQVDTKIRVLNRLLKDSEERAARLERLLAAAESLNPSPDAANSPPAPADSPRPAAAAPDRPAAALTELQRRILRLRDQGKTPREIAKATNLSTTEVGFAMESLDGFGKTRHD